MKQTAVEYLIKAFQGAYGDKVINVVSVQVEQAKEMEKQQIIDAHRSAYGKDGKTPNMMALGKIFDKQAEQYYNETFKK